MCGEEQVRREEEREWVERREKWPGNGGWEKEARAVG